MAWDAVEIVEAITRHLRARAAAADLEQAVYSIDALDELQLHPLIQTALREAGFGVWPEQRYSADGRRRRKSEGKRCDVVLTPDDLPLLEPDAETTLFADPRAVPLESAFWMEIKTVAQFTTEGAFVGYSSELLQPVTHDIKKMAKDGMLFHCGLLLVLFTAEKQVAEHDLAAWERRAIERGYGVAPPTARHFAINDRLGNACCSVALFPVRRL